ncbi:tRNA dihydrouridine synthase DusB [Spirochaetota bacterium]
MSSIIKIGKVKIQNNLVLAPISGYTDSPYRRVALKHGAGLVFTELISDEAIVRGNEKTLNMLKPHEGERPIAVQLFGRSPSMMAEAASVAEKYKPDLIDINMGCPARKVCKSNKGAALLKDPDNVFKIAESVVNAVDVPVSAKIRTGWDEAGKNYLEVVRALESAGISLISVHGRTKAQAFKGDVDWDIIKEIKSISSVPVIGNGDVKTNNEAFERLKFSQCNGIMIGREAIGNPWIFSGKTPSLKEIINQIKEHMNFMIEYYGDNGIILMRKHIVKYIHGFRNASRIRKELMPLTTKKEVFHVLDSLG